MIKNILLGAILPLLLVATGVGVFFGMRRPEPDKVPKLGSDRGSLLSKMPATGVQRVWALSEKSETLDIPVSGTVVPYREIELAAEVAGKVIDKDPNVRSGNVVKKGQQLLRIDPRDYELEVERLSRSRDQALAMLEELSQDIENTARLVDVAEQEFELADADVRRFESLGGIASPAELDSAKRSRLSSLNQRVTLQNQLRSFESKRSRLELAAQLAGTELRQAELNLARTIVRSPVDGRIVSEQVEADSYVQRGEELVVIEDTSQVEVALNLRMDQLYWVLDQNEVSADQLVNAAQASRYELPQIPVSVHFELAGRESLDYEWDGVLSRYDGAGLDPQSRTVPVRVLVPQPNVFRINGKPASESSRSGPPNLVRGMFVDVTIKARPATQLLLVPKLSIKPATGTNIIWKFEPDERAFDVVKQAHVEPEAAGSSEEPAPDRREPPGVEATEAAASGHSMPELLPAEWEAGFLHVIERVEVVGAYNGGEWRSSTEVEGNASDEVDYLVCEADGELQPGDFVIVTPLPGVKGDGNDTVRVSVDQLN